MKLTNQHVMDALSGLNELSNDTVKFYSESYSYKGFTLSRSVKFTYPDSFEFSDEILPSIDQKYFVDFLTLNR